MVFWTIVFFTISLLAVFNKGIFFETINKLNLLKIEKAEGMSEDEFNEKSVKQGCVPLALAIILLIIEVYYLIQAINYDTYKYPTVTAIFLIIIGLLANKKIKKVEDMSENERIVYKAEILANKRTLWSLVKSIFWTVYFGYMFYILVF
ncbi:hypothetical protein [Paenibacillus sp. NAIST15-1]|uniref:hypothetical protein n=1 Tax=Paenibacillus sp. NAIST15-1 TaxID=1605994 RepID=UPI000869FE6A|nr:hypothetical protein [Paenibacillus sp. NAIST15-1]GAV11478.1 hypothetical protein PBN151_1407 [Paenibacillus sp. NAIST15-1]